MFIDRWVIVKHHLRLNIELNSKDSLDSLPEKKKKKKKVRERKRTGIQGALIGHWEYPLYIYKGNSLYLV